MVNFTSRQLSQVCALPASPQNSSSMSLTNIELTSRLLSQSWWPFCFYSSRFPTPSSSFQHSVKTADKHLSAAIQQSTEAKSGASSICSRRTGGCCASLDQGSQRLHVIFWRWYTPRRLLSQDWCCSVCHLILVRLCRLVTRKCRCVLSAIRF